MSNLTKIDDLLILMKRRTHASVRKTLRAVIIRSKPKQKINRNIFLSKMFKSEEEMIVRNGPTPEKDRRISRRRQPEIQKMREKRAFETREKRESIR